MDKSESFRTKTEAQSWSAHMEADIVAGKHGRIPDKTFGDLLERYMHEVSPSKGSPHKEIVRIQRFLGYGKSDPDPLVSIRLPNIGPEHFADWRDRRLSCGSGTCFPLPVTERQRNGVG
ncbi:MAG: hypothetical protein Kow0060_07950 [Methylohalobius crimeensis]